MEQSEVPHCVQADEIALIYVPAADFKFSLCFFFVCWNFKLELTVSNERGKGSASRTAEKTSGWRERESRENES